MLFFHVIYLMDDLMLRNRYFSSQHARWNPLLTRIYYGTLIVIHTLRVQREFVLVMCE